MSDQKNDSGVTLALIQQSIELLQADVRDIKANVGTMHEQCIAEREFRRAVTYQLWGPDGKSRMEQVENKAESLIETRQTIQARFNAMIVALVVPAVFGVVSIIKSAWIHIITTGGSKP